MRACWTLPCLAILAACTSRPDGDRTPAPTHDWRRSLPASEELAGKTVAESRDGPWVVRSVGADGAGGRSLGRGAKASPLAPSGGLAPGAPMTDAAPEPDALAAGSEPVRSDRLLESMRSRSEVERPAEEAAEVESEGGVTPPTESPRLPLRAGVTDDNADFEPFLEFLEGWRQRDGVEGGVDFLDVTDRRYIRVVNTEGSPVPGARVVVVDEAADEVLFAGTTYGDGRVPYYPRVSMGERAPSVSESETLISLDSPRALIVEVTWEGRHTLQRWDGEGAELSCEIQAPDPVEEPIALDVLFLIDTTGSMSDEIDRVKGTLLEVTRRLRSIEREFDLRYGAVLYRDLGDEYVTRAHPLTPDIEAFDDALRTVVASGGGDGPESLNQGLAEAVGRTAWRERSARVMFLVADAPPHMDYTGDVPYGESLKAAVDRGIRIHSVAASGLDARGTFVFRQVAQFTRGKFIFIEYGSTASSAESHGVTGSVASNNLDEIIFQQIKAEVAGWGRS